jgi:hypothetical protein
VVVSSGDVKELGRCIDGWRTGAVPDRHVTARWDPFHYTSDTSRLRERLPSAVTPEPRRPLAPPMPAPPARGQHG